uniref:Uncharacterized protein n=1 Tax=Panstrongylus lignarius TaxID=156445 RepID=A0A224XML7_9HEMI
MSLLFSKPNWSALPSAIFVPAAASLASDSALTALSLASFKTDPKLSILFFKFDSSTSLAARSSISCAFIVFSFVSKLRIFPRKSFSTVCRSDIFFSEVCLYDSNFCFISVNCFSVHCKFSDTFDKQVLLTAICSSRCFIVLSFCLINISSSLILFSLSSTG